MFTDIRHQNSHSQLLKGSDKTAAQTVPGYFGAGRFPVEGILRAVRNPVDADTPVECGEKYGKFLPEKSRTIVRAFQNEQTESHDSQAAKRAAKKELLVVKNGHVPHQGGQAGQLSEESSQQSTAKSRIVQINYISPS